tara:strand:- start:72386 stop:73492 length:1107 start_codon:yes stop_codon:yes gene_type:complete
LYKLFNNFSDYDTYIYYEGSEKSKIWNQVSNSKIISKSPSAFKDALILLCGYNPSLANLDRSNRVFYFVQGRKLESRELTLLPILDTVVVDSLDSAYIVQSQMGPYKNKVRVVVLPAWWDTQPEEYPSVVNAKVCNYDEIFGHALNSIPRCKEDHKAWMIVNPETVEVLKYMAMGKPVLAPDKTPYSSLIINGFNGFLISKPGDVSTSIRQLKRNRKEISLNAKAAARAILSPAKYLDKLLNSVGVEPLPEPSKPSRWVIKERYFADGGIGFRPETIGAEFRDAEVYDLIEILEFLAIKKFRDAFVFGFDFPIYDAIEMGRVKTLLKILGENSLNIRFCLDGDIPPEWVNIFKKLSVVSVEEGLKQVR